MNNQYQYRKHIKYMKNFVSIFLLALTVILWVVILLGGKEMQDGIVPLSVLSIILFVEAIFIFKFLGRFTKVKVSIGSEGITYTNFKGDTTIKYEDITKIQFPAIKYTGGWIKIIAGKTTIRLTVVVENIQNLLIELKTKLDERNLNDKYDEKKFFKFLKTAAYADESWQRVYKIWWKLIIVSIVTTCIAFGSGIFYNFGGKRMVLSTVFSFIYPTIVYIITEIIFVKRIAKLSDKDAFTVPEPDLTYEGNVYKRIVWIAFICFVVITIAEILIG